MLVIYYLFFSVELYLGSFCYTLYVKYQNCLFENRISIAISVLTEGVVGCMLPFQRLWWCVAISLTKVLDFGHYHSYWVYCSRAFQKLGLFSQVEEWEKDPNLLGLFERTAYAFSKSFKWTVVLEFIPFPHFFLPPPEDKDRPSFQNVTVNKVACGLRH